MKVHGYASFNLSISGEESLALSHLRELLSENVLRGTVLSNSKLEVQHSNIW